jgi:hypothetical protein
MRNFSLIFLSLLISSVCSAQAKKLALKESEFDSLSYSFAMSGKHSELVSLFKKAKNNEIDFYYLRLRVGVSYFNKKQYLLALNHLQAALEFYPSDFTSKEYLFFCNLYLGNSDGAKEIVLKMPINSQAYYLNMIGKTKAINIESGYQIANYRNAQDTTTFLTSNGVFAESDRTKTLQYYQLGGDFILTNKVKLYTGFSFVDNLKNQHIYSKDNYYTYDYNTLGFNNLIKTKDTSIAYHLYQYQAYLGATINLKKQFKIFVGFQDMFYSQNKLSATADSSKSIQLDTLHYNYKYQMVSSTQNNFVSSISISKSYSKWNALLGIGYANIVKTSIFQLGGQLTFSPYGNYNLNITAGYFASMDTLTRSVGLVKVSGRISDSWWFEAYHYQGNLKNFHESNAYVIYNVSDVIKSKSGLSLSYYFNTNLSLGFRYDMLLRESLYGRYTTNNNSVFYNTFSDKYTMNSFIINLIWKYD